MKSTLIFSILFISLLFFVSCKKDQEPIVIEPVNETPNIEPQSYNVSEAITDDIEIGTVLASDTEGNPLTFRIISNDADLFELTSHNILSLASGKNLDYETATNHKIIIEVSDGTSSEKAEITIKVTNQDESIKGSIPFVTVWEISTQGESITIPINPNYNYNYSVGWGDGSISENLTDKADHTYDTTGTFKITISGEFPAPHFVYIDNNQRRTNTQIRDIIQWGNMEWKSMESAFRDCTHLSYSAEDAPNLTYVTSMADMFNNANSFNGNINQWDVSNIENMQSTFQSTAIVGNLSNWDVSSVTNMRAMFAAAKLFNGDLNDWDVSSVTDMATMFSQTESFNRDLNNWDVGNVNNMRDMFSYTKSFNGDISNWDVSSVTNFSQMFNGALAFNVDISNWNLSSALRLDSMFSGAELFNVDIGSWNVSNVSFVRGMFISATSFNQDISSWDVSNISDMWRMFENASSFNQNLGLWNIGNVNNMGNMFDNTALSIENYDQTLVGWSNLASVISDVNLGVLGLSYCDDGESARETLSSNGWTFIGDSKNPICQ